MRLISWNVQWCRGLDGRVSPQRIVDHARAWADVDVLCLQEVACGFDTLPGEPGDQVAELAALLPGYSLWFGAAVDRIDARGRRQRFGNLVATRLPVHHVEHHRLPRPADPRVPSMPRQCASVTVQDPELGPVRIMTTHLEYYSAAQRLAQAQALRQLHAQDCALALQPPQPEEPGGPFEPLVHTTQAVLCGDFNDAPHSPTHAAITEPFLPLPLDGQALDASEKEAMGWCDAWPLAHGAAPHPPTFRLFDRSHGPEPVACDWVLVSRSLAPCVRALSADLATQASDHQPLLLELSPAA